MDEIFDHLILPTHRSIFLGDFVISGVGEKKGSNMYEI